MIEILKTAPSFTETSSKRIKNFSLNLIFSDPIPPSASAVKDGRWMVDEMTIPMSSQFRIIYFF